MTATRDYRDFLGDVVMARRSIIRFAEGMTLDDSILFTTIDEDLKPLPPRLEAPARAHGVTPWKRAGKFADLAGPERVDFGKATRSLQSQTAVERYGLAGHVVRRSRRKVKRQKSNLT